MKKILVIEDDKEINRLICEYLAGQGYEMLTEANGLSGLRKLEENPDISLCILDLMLPFKSGDSVLKSLREFSKVPVIILSAKDTVQNKIDLIRMGADDYITKPFDLEELLVRIEAVTRRWEDSISEKTGESSASGDEKIFCKNMVLDRNLKIVTIGGNNLELTVKEYSILELFLMHPNKLFSKANLFESVWNEDYYAEDTTLKVHMSNLRNKIKKYDSEEYIETVWGMGYKLAE